MPPRSEHREADALNDRLRSAHAVTGELFSEVIGKTCRRFTSAEPRGKTVRIERLLQSGGWTDLALALIDLELPQWELRRIVYDEGQWHCALSRQRELPEWLDQSIETSHADLPLAILCAFVHARQISAPSRRTSVPAVPCDTSAPYIPFCCDNFA